MDEGNLDDDVDKVEEKASRTTKRRKVNSGTISSADSSPASSSSPEASSPISAGEQTQCCLNGCSNGVTNRNWR